MKEILKTALRHRKLAISLNIIFISLGIYFWSTSDTQFWPFLVGFMLAELIYANLLMPIQQVLLKKYQLLTTQLLGDKVTTIFGGKVGNSNKKSH